MSARGSQLIEAIDASLAQFRETGGTQPVIFITQSNYDQLEDHLLLLGDLPRVGELRAKRWKQCVVFVVPPDPFIYNLPLAQKKLKGEAL